MASIRFILNVNIKVKFEDTSSLVPFPAGRVYMATRIEVDDDGYNDIYMPDGSVLCGVASEAFENPGNKVPVTKVSTIQAAPENAEIISEEEIIEPAVILTGIQREDKDERNDKEEEDDWYDEWDKRDRD